MSSSYQKVIFFDLMGTCCDWLSSLLPLLNACPAHLALNHTEFAIRWREGFFQEIHARFARGEPSEDTDITHRRVLDRLLDHYGIGLDLWSVDVRKTLVQQWHEQKPWPDVIPALERFRKDGNWFLVVLANGTTRLQLDIAQSSNIPFHMLLSSELLGITKPDPAIYRKAMELVRLAPQDCYMCASHLYDLEAAKGVGMNTVYVHRDTEDVGIRVDLQGKHAFVDVYLDGRTGADDQGFVGVARTLIE